MFTLTNSDREWEKFGKDNPYFGVLTDEKYLNLNLSERNKADFFSSGESYMENIFDTIYKHIDSNFISKKALDFGCGVGRLTIPMAKRANQVTGVDISKSMLNEASKNCQVHGRTNVNLITSEEIHIKSNEKFDFIHSFIVFQHIPVKKGLSIFKNLLIQLDDGGVGVIHFTFAKLSPPNKLAKVIKNYFPLGANFINLIKKRPFFAPQIQMNSYNLDKILLILYRHYITNLHIEFTNHGDDLGAIIYFNKGIKSSKL